MVGGRVAGLILAAGAGRRMGVPKGLVRDGAGTPWVARAVRGLAGCTPVVVVVGAAAREVADLVPAPGEVVVAEDWAQGMGASLRAGLRALEVRAPADVVAALVMLVDLPGVTPAVVRRLAGCADGVDVLARAGYAGVAGHPVLLGRAHWAAVVDEAAGDAGARHYLARHPVALVECADVGDGRDVDTPPPGSEEVEGSASGNSQEH